MKKIHMFPCRSGWWGNVKRFRCPPRWSARPHNCGVSL